jgi:sterol desaturase/sphingolipid hydroxylase (fatty acid hydroxylase superfamily)
MAGGYSRSPLWLGIVLVLVLAELVWRVWDRRGYDGGGALTTLGLAIGNIPAALLHAFVVGGLFAAAWQLALFRFPLGSAWTWIAGFFVVEFAYYWFHRASHRLRWMWASHAVHHSAEQLTLLSSLRLGWTNVLSAGWLVYLPVILVGFDPRLVAALLVFDLHYQFFLHTEMKLPLGPLEWILNSPAHHRLHHGANSWCIDRNYGGVLIIFDRIFGSFAAECADDVIRYGLAGRPVEANPVKLAWREWRSMLAEMRKAGSVSRAIAIALAPP